MYAPVRNLERVRECALGLMVITTALFINSAHADTYNYVCTDHGKVLPPESRRQTEYPYMERKHLQNQKAVGLREIWWRAEREGASFDFCTATQGYADFEQNGRRIQCSLKR